MAVARDRDNRFAARIESPLSIHHREHEGTRTDKMPHRKQLLFIATPRPHPFF
jgi:hypothetical protein